MSQKKTEGSVFSQAHTAAANFAAEKSTKKNRKPSDHVEYDVMRANELGYGPHYGKYKADHPDTLAEFEALTGPKVQKVDPMKAIRTCPHCGEKFVVTATNRNKTYCSDNCRIKAQQDRVAGHSPLVHCAWCGKEIPRGSRRTKFCSDDCSYESYKDGMRKRKETTEIVSE